MDPVRKSEFKVPILEKFRQYHYDATVKVSENTRTLALSAIAIVWLFRRENGSAYEMPESLLQPLMLVLVAMSLDFFQYVYRSIVWHILFRSQERKLEKEEITEQSELYISSWINFPGYLFFYTKILFLIFAYWKLLDYFLHIVKWV